MSMSAPAPFDFAAIVKADFIRSERPDFDEVYRRAERLAWHRGLVAPRKKAAMKSLLNDLREAQL